MSNTFEVGAEFAGYRILEVIGSGGFANGYLGEDLRPAMRRKVALKVLRSELSAQEDFRDRFQRESLLAVQLDHHPNIVLRWGHVGLAVSSHDVGGITDRDVTFAERVVAVVASSGGEIQPSSEDDD